VVFAHTEIDGLGTCALVDQQVAKGVDRVPSHLPGDLIHALALVLLVVGLLTARYHYPVPAAHASHLVVAPARQSRLDLAADFGAGLRALESGHDFRRRTLEESRRQALHEPGHRRNIRVLVGGDVYAAVACRLDDGDLLPHLTPVGLTVHLEMEYVYGKAGLFADRDGFGQGGRFFGAFAADVAGGDAARAAGPPCPGRSLR